MSASTIRAEQAEHVRLCAEARALGVPTSLEDPRSPTTVRGLRDAIAAAREEGDRDAR